MKKILYITDHKDLNRFVDKNRLYRYQAVKMNNNFECRDNHDIDDIIPSEYLAICLSHETSPAHRRCSNIKIENLVNQFTKKFIYIEDFQRILKNKNYLYKNYSDIIVTYDGPFLDIVKNDINHNRVHLLTHHIDTSIIRDYKLEKKYDILFYGTLNDVYPFRKRMQQILQTEFKNCNLKIRIVDKKENLYGTDIAKLINQSWLTVATKSSYEYLLCKYFEISGCNSVLLGDIEVIGRGIWTDNFIEISNSMTTDKIVYKINDALQDKENLKKISNYMYDKISIEYSTHAYAKKLNNIIRNNS